MAASQFLVILELDYSNKPEINDVRQHGAGGLACSCIQQINILRRITEGAEYDQKRLFIAFLSDSLSKTNKAPNNGDVMYHG